MKHNSQGKKNVFRRKKYKTKQQSQQNKKPNEGPE